MTLLITVLSSPPCLFANEGGEGHDSFVCLLEVGHPLLPDKKAARAPLSAAHKYSGGGCHYYAQNCCRLRMRTSPSVAPSLSLSLSFSSGLGWSGLMFCPEEERERKYITLCLSVCVVCTYLLLCRVPLQSLPIAIAM